MRSLCVAWQAAVTLTFFHTVLDLVDNMGDAKSFGYTLPLAAQLLIVVVATVIVGCLVYQLQRGLRPLHHLYLVAIWSCYVTACARSFLHKDYFFPPEGQSALSVLLRNHASLLFVHGTFTVSAIATTWIIVARFREPEHRLAPKS